MLQVPVVRKTADENIRIGKYLRLLKNFFSFVDFIDEWWRCIRQKTEPIIYYRAYGR
jgi:hypothetical protein